ncbi:MAG TPA: redoxin domain-containing protein [Patescibacteria group bacterium]|jgi:peroxiredoxin|nr:redoxin domain-containing protein [Patescibacteria group bacterium]
MMKYLLLTIALLIVAPAYAEVLVGNTVPAVVGNDAGGHTIHLSDYRGHVIVLEWTSPACPYSQYRYEAGAIQALQRQVVGKRGIWLTIDSDGRNGAGYMTKLQALKFIKKHHSAATALIRDTDSHIAALFGVKTTPYIAIIDRRGRLAYAGAFDSNSGAQAADGIVRDYAHDALEDLWTGRPVRTAVTRTFGCMIKYAH